MSMTRVPLPLTWAPTSMTHTRAVDCSLEIGHNHQDNMTVGNALARLDKMLQEQQVRRSSYAESMDDQAEGDPITQMHMACTVMGIVGIDRISELWQPGVTQGVAMEARPRLAELLAAKVAFLPGLGRACMAAMWGELNWGHKIVSSTNSGQVRLSITKGHLPVLLSTVLRIFGASVAWHLQLKGDRSSPRMLLPSSAARWRFGDEGPSEGRGETADEARAPFEEWPRIRDIGARLVPGSTEFLSFTSSSQQG
mmetsp:Transcript_113492/g.367157  ORF Transcript_113492/g.367157 Transcript_113492/m.367157 type:complete len:253 (-) Transcript_113492:2-760(-)